MATTQDSGPFPRITLPPDERLTRVEADLGEVAGKVDLIYDFLAEKGAVPRRARVPAELAEAMDRGPGLHRVRVPVGDRMVLVVIDGEAGGDPEVTYQSILRATGQPDGG